MTLRQRNVLEARYGHPTPYRSAGATGPHGPHRTHWRLHDRLAGVLLASVRELACLGLSLTVLEVGAGHGGYTEPALAAGCSVTAVQMSGPSLRLLDHRYGTNPNFRAVFDRNGSLADVEGVFSLITCVSVLHHVPHYVGYVCALMDRIRPGGVLVALQDPLLYTRISRITHTVDWAGYYASRLRRGQLRSRSRPATVGRQPGPGGGEEAEGPGAGPGAGIGQPAGRHHLPRDLPRDGVDQAALTRCLRERFAEVTSFPYWSNQSPLFQRFGEWVGIRNTFGIVASGFRG